MSDFPPPSPSGPPGGYQSPPPGHDPFGQAVHPGGTAVGSEDGTKLLILSILSLVCCGPIAIYTFIESNRHRKSAEAAGRQLDGMVKASWVLSIIAGALFLLGIAMFALGILSFGVST